MMRILLHYCRPRDSEFGASNKLAARCVRGGGETQKRRDTHPLSDRKRFWRVHKLDDLTPIRTRQRGAQDHAIALHTTELGRTQIAQNQHQAALCAAVKREQNARGKHEKKKK